MKLPKVLTLVAFFGSVWTLFNLSGCATARPAPVVEQPGMYDLRGWADSPTYQSGSGQVAGDRDIDGEVGRPLYVAGPTARIVPKSGWNSRWRLVSGTLPPGLSFDSAYAVTGIPTERGHWIVTVELYDVMANGASYLGLKQQLRFHITGSGRVNN